MHIPAIPSKTKKQRHMIYTIYTLFWTSMLAILYVRSSKIFIHIPSIDGLQHVFLLLCGVVPVWVHMLILMSMLLHFSASWNFHVCWVLMCEVMILYLHDWISHASANTEIRISNQTLLASLGLALGQSSWDGEDNIGPKVSHGVSLLVEHMITK